MNNIDSWFEDVTFKFGATPAAPKSRSWGERSVSYINDCAISLKAWAAEIYELVMSCFRCLRPQTAAEQLGQKMRLQELLPKLIVKAIPAITPALEKIFNRFPEFSLLEKVRSSPLGWLARKVGVVFKKTENTLRDGLSYPVRLLLWLVEDLINSPLNNVIGQVLDFVTKDDENKSKMVITMESSVIGAAAESLSEINKAYVRLPDIEKMSEAEQAYQVLRELEKGNPAVQLSDNEAQLWEKRKEYTQQNETVFQAYERLKRATPKENRATDPTLLELNKIVEIGRKVGGLHEAIALLSLEEEKLWASRHLYLFADESVYVALERMKKEGATDDIRINTRIAQLEKLLKIETKIEETEHVYLKGLAEKIFDNILFPDGSLEKRHPVFAKKIRKQAIRAIAYVLASQIDTYLSPVGLYRQLITLFPTEEQPPSEVKEIKAKHYDGLNQTTEKVVVLATELARSGSPKYAYLAESALGIGNAAHGVISWLMPTSWVAKETLESYKPDKMINEAVTRSLDSIHELALNCLTEDKLNSILEDTGEMLEQQVKARQSMIVAPEVETKGLLKEQAKEGVAKYMEDNYSKNDGSWMGYAMHKVGLGKILAETSCLAVDRLSNDRVAKQLAYAGFLRGLEEGIEKLAAEIKETPNPA